MFLQNKIKKSMKKYEHFTDIIWIKTNRQMLYILMRNKLKLYVVKYNTKLWLKIGIGLQSDQFFKLITIQ